MIEQNLPEAIELEDINKYKVRGKPETIKRIYKLFNRIGKDLGFTLSDITVTLGISNPPDFPIEKIKAINVFLAMPESPEKDKFRQENKIDNDLIQAYQEDIKNRDERFKRIPAKLTDYLLSAETDDDINEIRDIIQISTGIKPEVIKETDAYVLVELLLRVFLKAEDAVQRAFFLKIVLNLFKKFMDLLNITRIEK